MLESRGDPAAVLAEARFLSDPRTYGTDVVCMDEKYNPPPDGAVAQTKKFIESLKVLDDSLKRAVGDAPAIRAAMKVCYEDHTTNGVDQESSCDGIRLYALFNCTEGKDQGDADPWHVFCLFERVLPDQLMKRRSGGG